MLAGLAAMDVFLTFTFKKKSKNKKEAAGGLKITSGQHLREKKNKITKLTFISLPFRSLEQDERCGKGRGREERKEKCVNQRHYRRQVIQNNPRRSEPRQLLRSHSARRPPAAPPQRRQRPPAASSGPQHGRRDIRPSERSRAPAAGSAASTHAGLGGSPAGQPPPRRYRAAGG